MWKTILFVSAVLMLPLGAETRNLVPSATSTTAARGCSGVDLQAIKTAKGFTRRYVFTQESPLLKSMHFCVNGVVKVDDANNYRVPAGSVAWVNADGTAGVLEECVNEFGFVSPVGPEPTAPVVEAPAFTAGTREVPDYSLPAWTPATASAPTPEPKCPKCLSIRSSYQLAELGPKSPPIEVWAEIADGALTDGVWTFAGYEVGRGLRVTLDPRKLYKQVGGKSGEYFLHFVGRDSEGHVVACGQRGTPLKLEKRGRHWFWKLPVVHCIYAYTADIKNWSKGGVAEKMLCLGEGAAAWYFWPVATGPGGQVSRGMKPPTGVAPGRIP